MRQRAMQAAESALSFTRRAASTTRCGSGAALSCAGTHVSGCVPRRSCRTRSTSVHAPVALHRQPAARPRRPCAQRLAATPWLRTARLRSLLPALWPAGRAAAHVGHGREAARGGLLPAACSPSRQPRARAAQAGAHTQRSSAVRSCAAAGAVGSSADRWRSGCLQVSCHNTIRNWTTHEQKLQKACTHATAGFTCLLLRLC